MSERDTILSLCDLTGNITTPWVDAGYNAVLVDPQHGFYSIDGATERLPYTVAESLDSGRIAELLPRLAFVAAFPPCTDLAVSGARWFASKRAADPLFQAKAVAVAEQCRTIGRLSGAPWFVENPVSVLSSVFGKPDYTFHPFHFTGHEPADNYTKNTCLWVGGGFRMPPTDQAAGLSEPDSRIHHAPPSAERANFRSATPMGFARAVYAANHERTTP